MVGAPMTIMKPKKLIQVTGDQFGGVGVNCHQPLGSKSLLCPYDRDNPFPYQPAFQAFGDKTYSGEFECDPSDSIQAEASTIPDASQFLSADQIDQIEQILKLNEYESNSPALESQDIETIAGFPISGSDENFQLPDTGLDLYVDENVSDSQLGTEVFSDMLAKTVSDQDISPIGSPDYSSFLNGDIVG
jgi:hypothetical protein